MFSEHAEESGWHLIASFVIVPRTRESVCGITYYINVRTLSKLSTVIALLFVKYYNITHNENNVLLLQIHWKEWVV